MRGNSLDAGMKGEQAGTTLRAAMIRLADPPKEAAAQLAALGVQVTDSAGEMLPLDSIIGQLATSMDGMGGAQKNAALAAIFGSEAMTGMLSLVEAGPEKFNALTLGLQNSGGASAETAAKMKDNLTGSLQELSGAAETAQISIGSALAPAIRTLADALSGLVGWFNNLSPQTQRFIAIGAALSAGLLVLVGVVGFLVTGLGFLAAAQWAAIIPVLAFVGIVAAVIAVVGVLAFLTVKYWGQIKAWTTTAWTAIKTVIMNAWDAVVEMFRAAWGVVGPIVMAYWESIKAVWTAAFSTIKALLSAWWEVVKTLFATAFLAVYYIVTGQWDKIGGVFQAARDKLQGIVSKLWESLKAIWSTAAQQLTESTSNLWSGIKDVFSNAWAGIKSWFTGVVADARQMGVDMMRGMIAGVMSMASSIASAAANVVSSAISAAKSALKIKSPSRVFMEIGGYTAEGMAIGMEDGTGMIRDAASLLAGATLPSAVMAGTGSGSGTAGTTVIIELDGRVLAKSTFEQMGGTLRGRGAVT